MFSQSNSYLGGPAGGRPGGPPFNQGQFAPQQPGQQQQQYGVPPEQTGYGGGLQSQATGYVPQQQPQHLQQQPTGYPMQNGSLQPQQPQQYQQQPFQPQQTGFVPPQQQPMGAPQQQPQPTGMTSAQMANSFSSAPSQTTPQPPSTTSNSNIPKQRLSFVTATDQAKFEQLFKSAVGSNRALSGDQARGLLMRSQLPGEKLSSIWTLADTTKSGQLLFPEFALAMYLCNLALVGKTIPSSLPEKIRNEVSSMVDIISFAIPDDQPQRPPPRSKAPNFMEQQPATPQPSNSQLLSSLAPQATGYPPQNLQTQATGFVPQQSGYPPQLQPQQTAFSPQQTGYPSNPQATGYSGPRPPMPPMPSSFQQPMQTGMAPLNAQPTGRPGQWGLVNAPASGLPNIEALQAQMMPQQGREGGFTTSGLRGNATVPWAVTKDEKKMYDNLFKSWDGFGKGHILGSQAIEIFGQSGLDKPDLEKIWTLSDPSNRGRLDLDEFAVAMHLIYRKLNGYPVPNRLPPELVPPSTRNLNASLGTVKSLLSRDAEERKNSPASLEPQKTGVSYLKNHSFSAAATNGGVGRKDATVYRNNDEDVGYRSSARHRLRDGGRSPSPAQTPSPSSELADDVSLEDLQKRIREKQVLLDAIDFQDENDLDQDDILDRKDRKDADDLYNRIRRVQEDIDANPNSTFKSGDSGAERRTLKRQLQGHQDRLPDLASQVRRVERTIADAQLELFRLKDAKAHPSSAAPIMGTGPGGAVTESDRVKARAKAMMQQRSAALAGKPIPADNDDSAAASRRLEEESSRVRTERETNDRMVKDIEEGVATYSRSVEESLRDGQDETQNHEKRRWEDGLGVEDEIKEFIFDLQRSSRAARVRREDRPRDRHDGTADDKRSKQDSQRRTSPPPERNTATSAAPAASGGNYSSYKTAEDRAAFIKQQAAQRMAERLAALGIQPTVKSSDTSAQDNRQENDREARRRQGEEEEARVEKERQRRLDDEQISPPSAANGKSSKKAPPAPPSRTSRADSSSSAKRGDNEASSRALKDQRDAQEAEIKSMESGQHRQEAELARQREEADTRRRALEEKVRQGKMAKEEEKARKKAAKRETEETKVREDRLAAQRAEVEAAKQQEAELQRQLQALDEDDSSSDDEGPQQITPTGSSQELSSPPVPNVPPSAQEKTRSPPAVTSPATSTDPGSNNPFFKKMQTADPPASTSTSTSAQPQQKETNPFHRFSNSHTTSTTPAPAPALQPQSTGPNSDRRTRARAASEDDWSVLSSSSSDRDADSDNEDSGAANRSGAKHLASILFGTMAPPRPMSAVGTGDGAGGEKDVGSPKTPQSADPMGLPGGPPPPPPPMSEMGAPTSGPPPPPMMPGGFPGAPPPPPPPAMPSSGGSGSGPPTVGALLGQIQLGKGLKKTVTKDRSASGVAGRVLG